MPSSKNANRMPVGRPNRMHESAVTAFAARPFQPDVHARVVPTNEAFVDPDVLTKGRECGVARADVAACGDAKATWLGHKKKAAAKAECPQGLVANNNTIIESPPPRVTMGAAKRMSNGETKPVGPHPSTICVAAQYMTQAAIDRKLFAHVADTGQERSLAEAREDSIRLQGVTWIDQVRRALSLPIRTYTTACCYYHRFRLANPGVADQAWADTAAAALLLACKSEDTLKKSRDILAAAYNLKSHDHLTPDDVVFDLPSKAVIGLERMMLEASGFDFRAKYPHDFMTKLGRSLDKASGDSQSAHAVSRLAWTVLTDTYRTFAPLKQTPQTMAFAALEMAAHLIVATNESGANQIRDRLQAYDYQKASTSREEIMETLLDLLDLYTHHTAGSILGTKFSLDNYLRIRLALNKECDENGLPRYTQPKPKASSGGPTSKVSNGHPTPVSPPQPGTQTQSQASAGPQYPPVPEGGGTLRFMLNPEMAAEEKTEVQKYFTEEWEEYEEEVEVPAPSTRSASHDRSSNRDRDGDREKKDRERSDRAPRSSNRERRGHIDERRSKDDGRDHRDRDRDGDREHERHRDRDHRDRERDRDRRYDDRRYDERDRYDRRESRRYDDEYDRRRR